VKKIILSLAATALVATSSFAFDASEYGIYAGGGVSMVSASFSDGGSLDSGFALVLNAGIPVMKLTQGTILVEGEISKTVVSLSDSYTDYDENDEPISESYDIDFLSIGIFAAYKYDFTNQYYAKAKLGFISQTIDSDGYTDDGMGLAYGVQAGYNMNETISFYTEVNMNNVNTNIDVINITIGAQYHF
jgi:hypothetical protein